MRSCIRPWHAAGMAAGLDELRGARGRINLARSWAHRVRRPLSQPFSWSLLVIAVSAPCPSPGAAPGEFCDAGSAGDRRHAIDAALGEQRSDDTRHLVGQGDCGHFEWTSRQQSRRPFRAVRIAFRVPQPGGRAEHEQASPWTGRTSTVLIFQVFLADWPVSGPIFVR